MYRIVGFIDGLEPDSAMDFQRCKIAGLHIFSAVARLKCFASRALFRLRAAMNIRVASVRLFRYEANYFGLNTEQHQR
jgi:hypothetical protein